MKFDLVDLRIVLSAVEGGSLTAAAAQNNIVVAAVSARLRRMEKSLGLELFERTGRGIRPTLVGEMLVRHACKIIGAVRQAEAELDGFVDGGSGHVRLLSNTNMLAEHLPQALGAFLAANPDISVSVVDKPSLEVVNMLKNGEAEIGIVAASADMIGLERWRFVPDQLVAVVPAGFDLPPGPIPFTRVLDFELIGLNGNPALMQFLARQANELGRKLSIRTRVDGFESTCRMVEAGAGIAILPCSAAHRYGRFMRLGIVDMAEDWGKRELYLCVRNEAQLPACARKLLTHLQDYAAGLQA